MPQVAAQLGSSTSIAAGCGVTFILGLQHPG
eukprot:CAMPEP_0202902892 /NCGR_PEP_ID=MMETSP1392-20130828/18715_1 /ASSEMBLY_ACC=CAM_ASM_000868 /TAXON_ID=225041 /ORGANISM="Chlamydomonas chlamydogama, Strain SAG 11-48b" /LENGTH=30 /DNA_ID= /DNA_START= /DNA_END= /DNA_ORIENTATION=